MYYKHKEFMETPTASLNISTYTSYDVTNYASATVTIPQYDESWIEPFSINTQCTNCVASSSNPTIIFADTTATLVFNANEGYAIPTSLSVIGATTTWTITQISELSIPIQGTLVLSNPTQNLNIAITCEQIQMSYAILTSNQTYTPPTELIGTNAVFQIFSGFEGGQGGYNGSIGTTSLYEGGAGGSGGTGGTSVNYLRLATTLANSYNVVVGAGGEGGASNGGNGSLGSETIVDSYSSSTGTIINAPISNLLQSSILYNQSGLSGIKGGNGGRLNGRGYEGSAGQDVTYQGITYTGGLGGNGYSQQPRAGGGGGGGAAVGNNGSPGGDGHVYWGGSGGNGANAIAPSQALLGHCGDGGHGGGGGGNGGAGEERGSMGTGGSGSIGGQGSNGFVVVYTQVFTATLTTNLTNITAEATNPSTMLSNNIATLIFKADNDYVLPSSISVVGAQYTWNHSTGTLVLQNPMGNINISISGTPI